LTVATNR